MKKTILFISILMTSLASFAVDLKCTAKKGSDIAGTVEITMTADNVEINKSGAIGRMSLLIRTNTDSDAMDEIGIPDFAVMEDRNLPADSSYQGRKYKGYIKYILTNYETRKTAGDFTVEDIDLLLSPDYKVTKTESVANNWDPNWTWDLEYREYDAQFPLHLNDHHGDYIPGKCYTVVKVNEKRG